MKLHVYLRNLGVASRRKAEELIAAGRVEVDGKMAHIGQLVQGNENVRVDGVAVKSGISYAEKYYLLVNKPVDYTSTTADYYDNEKSVLELLPYELKKLTQWQIVGRLDKNSEGLLLLTNDGNLGYVLTHPKFEVKKEYVVTVSRALTESERQKLLAGVVSEAGEQYIFQKIDLLPAKNEYKITLTEGKKREIREAIGMLGINVLRLVRVSLGSLKLGELAPGGARLLSEGEVEQLRSFVQGILNSIPKQVHP